MNMPEISKREYISRINKVMDYIEEHFEEEINLATLSSIAYFSPYHFHRIFTAIVGETPANFLQRIRIEKAAQQLKNYPNIPISEVAYKCGFSSISVLSRTFRKYFGITAKEYRVSEQSVFVHNNLRYSKNGKLISKIGQICADDKLQLCDVKLKQMIMNTKIVVKEMPEMNVIYCRHIGTFNQIGKAYEKLFKWAGPRGLLKFPETKTITVYHDDPAITAIEKVRQSACITVSDDVKVEGEIGKMKIPAGKYAVGNFEITENEFEKAWNTMCLWLTESGYEPAEESTYELYYNDHNQHPEKKFILDICIPLKSL